MKHLLILLSILFCSSQAFPQNTQITSFSKSKKLLLKLYKDNPVTLYCGCSYKGKKPNFSSCGYIPKKDNKRANRIEWEHIVPVHSFGQSFSEWMTFTISKDDNTTTTDNSTSYFARLGDEIQVGSSASFLVSITSNFSQIETVRILAG